MELGITVDLKYFNEAFNSYMEHTHRNLVDVCNSKLGDVAMRAAQFSPKANKGSIQGLPDDIRYTGKKWWPAYINKIVSAQGYTLHFRRKAKTFSEQNVFWRDPVDRTLHFGRKTMGYNVEVGRDNATHRRLKQISDRIIRRRIATINSFRAIFSYVAEKFGKRLSRVGKGWGNLSGVKIRHAKVGSYFSEFIIPFVNKNSPIPGSRKPSPEADVEGKRRIAEAALKEGIAFVEQDMRQYVLNKQAEAAMKYFPRSAA